MREKIERKQRGSFRESTEITQIEVATRPGGDYPAEVDFRTVLHAALCPFTTYAISHAITMPPCFTRHGNTARPTSSPHGAVPYPGVSSRRGRHLEDALHVPSRICGRVGVSS